MPEKAEKTTTEGLGRIAEGGPDETARDISDEQWRRGLDEELEEYQERERQREAHFRRVEILIWCLSAGLVASPFWQRVYSSGESASFAVSQTYGFVLAAVLVVVFPILYRLVFGLLPVQHLRANRAAADRRKRQERRSAATAQGQLFTVRDTLYPADLGPDSDPERALAAFVQSSRRLAQRVLTRAGIYLVLGVLIAFAGVLFFYLQTVSQPTATGAIEVIAEQFARNWVRFGILFFVEFIAIFFLRQYRSDMEEFRYYEAIQRKREESFVLVRFMKTQDEKVDVTQLIEVFDHSASVGRLAAGESTELIEAKKSNDDTDFLVKIIEAATRFRKG